MLLLKSYILGNMSFCFLAERLENKYHSSCIKYEATGDGKLRLKVGNMEEQLA